ncbi:MAG: NADP oxidoreductase [Saprospiraceae bacterium]|nr:NADP oxidoreductase [Saprospiraceae bacterium]
MDRTQTLNCLWKEQNENGHLSQEFIKTCASNLGISSVELEGVISFYHFFKKKPQAEFTIYVNNSIVSETKGLSRIKEAFVRETGADFGKIGPAGKFGLYETACIGLSDVEPAALINFHPFTNLTSLKVRKIIAALKKGEPVESICDTIEGNIRYYPPAGKSVFIREYHPGLTVHKLANLGQKGIIKEIKKSGLRGMGGAYFPAGIKMESCANQPANPKYVVCNADEGEPGTFKDRLILHKYPGLMLEGMIASGYAIGAREGIIYLRAEYQWLQKDLENAIEDFKRRGYLGKSVSGIEGFDFDIRIQLGAGAYVCGEETAMLNSMEGKRGEPRTKQYFPTERGFLNKPTQVNNVETFAAISRIIELGPDHFMSSGTESSPGTKLISISGDCHKPGIYEIEWGTKISDLLNLCHADDPFFIQVSGPSGQCLNPNDFERELSMDDIRCGGSFMIFNSKRNLLNILRNFTAFFKTESCGVCTPCRAGNFIIERKLEKIANGLAYAEDYEEIKQWGKIMQRTSRCGLGKAATNALQDALSKCPDFFENKFMQSGDGFNKKFDMRAALEPYEKFKD